MITLSCSTSGRYGDISYFQRSAIIVFVWIGTPKQTAWVYKLSEYFLDKDGHCSLKGADLFGWREYFVREWQADIYLLMSLVPCDKTWQRNCEWNNLSPFHGTLSYAEFMPCPSCLKCVSFLRDVLGKIPTKSPLLFSKLSALLCAPEVAFFVFPILPRRIYLFMNTQEIWVEVSKKIIILILGIFL